MRREDLSNVDPRLTRTEWAHHQITIQRAMNPEKFNLPGPPLPVYFVRHPSGTTLDVTTDWLEAYRYAKQTGSAVYELRGRGLHPWRNRVVA